MYMKRFFILLLLPFFSLAQDNDELAISYTYPLAIGNNFISTTFYDGYEGIISLVANYTFEGNSDLRHGIQFRPSYLNDQIQISDENRTNLYTLNLSYQMSTNIGSGTTSIIPNAGIGVTSFHFRTSEIRYFSTQGRQTTIEAYKNNKIGLALNLGVKFAFNPNPLSKWYVIVDYEFNYLNQGLGPDSPFNRTAQFINIGMGTYIPLTTMN